MGPDILDLIIIVTLVLFTIRGLKNGFVVEVAGLLSLICGFWAASAWSAELAPRLDFIFNPALRYVAAYVLIFVAAMCAVAIVARLFKKIIVFAFASWLDRIIGACLGLAKGLLVWALILIVLERLFPDTSFLHDSRAAEYINPLLNQIKQWLPPEWASHIPAES